MLEVVKSLVQLGTSDMPAGWAVFMGVCIFAVFLLLK